MTTPAEIKQIRLDAGYTQQEMADIIGVCRRTIINWEQGTTPIYEPAWRLMLKLSHKRTQRTPS